MTRIASITRQVFQSSVTYCPIFHALELGQKALTVQPQDLIIFVA